MESVPEIPAAGPSSAAGVSADSAPAAAEVGALRIALVTETYPPEVNGVAHTLSTLTAHLAARGHSITVIRPRHGRGDTPRRDEHGVRHLPVPGAPLPRYSGLRFGLPAGRRLAAAWRRARPSVVHVATEGPLGASAAAAARRLGVPVTSSFHTNFHSYGKHYGYGVLERAVAAYLRRFHNRTRVTMVPSADVSRALTSAGFERVEVVGRGVDTELFDPVRRDPELRRAWGAGDDTLVALYVGRLAPEKNVALALEAFEALSFSARGAARMVLVGDGPSRPALERRGGSLVFTGMRLGEELAAHYASADVLLFPSVTETFGNVVTEGLASGLAVLAYDYAAAGQHVEDGVNGLKVAFDDEDAYLAAAARLGSETGLAARLGAAARESAEGITWRRVTDDFEGHLRAAAGLAEP